MSDYEKYKLQWMINHGYSIIDLMNALNDKQNSIEDTDPTSHEITRIFSAWEYEDGFGGELWVCEEEWKECEGSEIMD